MQKENTQPDSMRLKERVLRNAGDSMMYNRQLSSLVVDCEVLKAANNGQADCINSTVFMASVHVPLQQFMI